MLFFWRKRFSVWWDCFRLAISVSLSKVFFKDSYTNVSNFGGTRCFRCERGGVCSLRHVKIQTRYFLQTWTRKDQTPLLFATLQ